MTGAEALQKILETVDGLKNTVDELKSSIQLIEANIKILNNRAAGLMRESQPVYPNTGTRIMAPAPVTLSAGVPEAKAPQQLQAGIPAPSRGRQMNEVPEAKRNEAMNFIREADDNPGILTYKKVFGRLVNNDSEPIESVLINVYDRNNEVCATTETDPIGYWEIMLRPGRYMAEYTKSGFKTTNKRFEVGKNSKQVEVK